MKLYFAGTPVRCEPRTIRVNGKLRKLHRVIWEKIHSPIREGYDIHHKDGNPLNNAPSNLLCLSREAHMRIHSGWTLERKVWRKPCPECRKVLPTTRFYRQSPNKKSGGEFRQFCKKCWIRRKSESRILRRAV